LRRSFERNRRMRSADIAATSFAQRELELAAREAELNRREAALRRHEELRAHDDEMHEQTARDAVILRENELLRREAAVRHAEELLEDETMRRAQLEQRERELEQLRDAGLDAELEAIKLEQARAVAADLADVERNQPTEDVPPPLRVEAAGEWWARQLGAPLEAA